MFFKLISSHNLISLLLIFFDAFSQSFTVGIHFPQFRFSSRNFSFVLARSAISISIAMTLSRLLGKLLIISTINVKSAAGGRQRVGVANGVFFLLAYLGLVFLGLSTKLYFGSQVLGKWFSRFSRRLNSLFLPLLL